MTNDELWFVVQILGVFALLAIIGAIFRPDEW